MGIRLPLRQHPQIPLIRIHPVPLPPAGLPQDPCGLKDLDGLAGGGGGRRREVRGGRAETGLRIWYRDWDRTTSFAPPGRGRVEGLAFNGLRFASPVATFVGPVGAGGRV